MIASCPCCGSGDTRFLYPAADRELRLTDRTFELRECRGCRVIFLFPLPNPEELKAYYPPGYWWQTVSPSLRRSFWHRLLESFRQVMVRGHVGKIKRLAADSWGAGARLLDIGCGDGSFLAACGELPLVRLGLDVSLDAARAAKQRGGLVVVQGSIETLPFADQSFAVITLFHVLEHLSNPIQCLREANRLLRPGGCLLLQVPNTASLERHLLGPLWAGFEVPRHLINYSLNCLGPLLEQQGFTVTRVDHFSWRDNPSVLVRSFFPRLYPPSRRQSRAPQSSFNWADNVLDLLYLFSVLLASPLSWTESLIGRGGIIFIEARKP